MLPYWLCFNWNEILKKIKINSLRTTTSNVNEQLWIDYKINSHPTYPITTIYVYDSVFGKYQWTLMVNQHEIEQQSNNQYDVYVWSDVKKPQKDIIIFVVFSVLSIPVVELKNSKEIKFCFSFHFSNYISYYSFIHSLIHSISTAYIHMCVCM